MPTYSLSIGLRVTFYGGITFFIYIENYLSEEARYQKELLVKFIDSLGCIGGVTPMTKDDKKNLKHLINIQLLMKALSQEDRKNIFGKPLFLSFVVFFNFHVSDVYVLLVVV